MPSPLSPEDEKLITLAKAARARIEAVEGAAVRDETGRSYTGATVDLGDFHLSALQLAVAAAASSGANGLEAAAVVSGDLTGTNVVGLVEVAELGSEKVPVFICDETGAVVSETAADVDADSLDF